MNNETKYEFLDAIQTMNLIPLTERAKAITIFSIVIFMEIWVTIAMRMTFDLGFSPVIITGIAGTFIAGYLISKYVHLWVLN